MRDYRIWALWAAASLATVACGIPEDAPSEQSTGERVPVAVAEASPAAQAGNDAGDVAHPVTETTYPAVSRTRTGNGGVVALAGETTFEFEYVQGRCEAAEGRFKAKGADPGNAGHRVTVDYANIVDPNSGRSLGPAFQLEIRTGEDEVWAAHVGTGMAGKIEDLSQAPSTGGGTMLTVTGVAVGFHNNGAMIGRTVPFRLEAVCE